MNIDQDIQPALRDLFASQRFAVLATDDCGQPFASLSREIDAALRELFLVRHPNLAGFAATPTCTVVSVRITSYQLVSQFERIREWRPEATVTVSSQ